jgi:hypothetical protein
VKAQPILLFLYKVRSSLKEILNYKSDQGKIEIQFLLVIDNDTRNVNCHVQEWCV